MNKLCIYLLAFLLTVTPKSTAKAAEHAVETDFRTIITLQLAAVDPVQIQPLELQTVVIGEANSVINPPSLKQLAEELVNDQFGPGHFTAFAAIVQHESGWNPKAINRRSGACGLPQALPCSKIKDQTPVGQLNWMISYIKNRYGTPNDAWRIWKVQRWY